MKKSIFIFSLIAIFAITLNSCKKDKEPTITVTPVEDATGWFGDDVVFDIVINSTEDVTLTVTNEHDAQTLTESYDAGESTTQFTYTVPNDVTDGQEIKVTFVVANQETELSTTVEETITIATGGTGEDVVHEGTLTEDEIWSAGDNHIIDGTLYLEGNTITIEAGTVIKMNAGAKINVGNNPDASTALIAEGTEAQPITFTSSNASPVAGDWHYISFDEGTSPNTTFQYCVFEYGGGYADYSAMIVVNGNTEIAMDYCTLRYSETSGARLNDENARFSSFTNNTISDITKNPIYLEANNADCIGTNNTITDEGSYGIFVDGGTMNKDDATWKVQTVPYIIGGTVYVESASGAILTIEAGNTISFRDGAEINVANSDFGTLIANGTSSNPITFTSANATPSAGDWDGIFMYEGCTNSSFKYCTFEYGGGYADYSAIIVASSGVEFAVENSTIKYSEAYGIVLDDGASFSSFQNNTMSDIANEFIYLSANAVDGVGTGNDFQSTLTNKGIKIGSSTMDKPDVTWLNQNAPYIIQGTVYIESTSGTTLTIEAGTTISFYEGGQIDVANSNYGKIVAQGTADNKITFTSSAPAGDQGEGDWDGIFLYDGTSNGTIFDHCVFEYGGGYAAYSASLYMNSGVGTKVTVTNSLFEYSEAHGISYDGSDNPTISGNTFNNIAGEDINIR